MRPHEQNPLEDDIDLNKQLYSVGFLCAMLQQPITFIERLAQLAEVEPCQVIDGVAHYDGIAVQKMAAKLQELRDKVETIEAAPMN
jgi:hypothetical protein